MYIDTEVAFVPYDSIIPRQFGIAKLAAGKFHNTNDAHEIYGWIDLIN